MNTLNKIVYDENGATAIEYSLIAALISVGIIASTRNLGGKIKGVFDNVNNTMIVSGSGTSNSSTPRLRTQQQSQQQPQQQRANSSSPRNVG